MAGGIRFGVELLRYDEWPSLAERVGRYEALGLDTFWVPDHVLTPALWGPRKPAPMSVSLSGPML